MALPLDRTRKGKLSSGAEYSVHTRPLLGSTDANKSKLVTSKAVKTSGSTTRAVLRSSTHGDGLKSKPRRAESRLKMGKLPGGEDYSTVKRKQSGYRDQETDVYKERSKTLKASNKKTVNGGPSQKKKSVIKKAGK